MIHLELETTHQSVDGHLLEKVVRATLDQQKASQEVDLSIVISSDEKLQQLNLQFLGVDAPTDVLSFPADFSDPETGVPYLGDVVISYPRVKAQAAAGRHTEQEELQLLVVHGILHLLGHDHAHADEKKRMWAAQSEILNSLGVSIITPSD